MKGLNSDHRLQLKQDILTRRMDEKGESPSWGELVDTDSLVSVQDMEEFFNLF